MAKLVFDASAVISLFDSRSVHHSWALSVFTSNGDAEFFISALTYAEILVHPAKVKQLESFSKNLAKAGFQVVGINQDSADEIAKTRAITGLKMPDAVVLSLAKEIDATLVSTDKDVLAKAKTAKLKTLKPRN